MNGPRKSTATIDRSALGDLPGDIDGICLDAFGTIVEITDKRRPWRALMAHLPAAQRKALAHRALTEDMSLRDAAQATGLAADDPLIARLEADQAAEIASIRWRPGMKQRLQQIKASGLKLAICSNLAAPYGPPLAAMLAEIAPDALILSYAIGHKKPDRSIYRKLAEKLGIPPARLLFTGDTPEADVQGPARAGFNSMLIGAFERALPLVNNDAANPADFACPHKPNQPK